MATATFAFAEEPAGKVSVDVTLTGIDILARDNFAALDGRKVGLITNHTGLDRNGKSTLALLNEAPNVKLVALFSPEHGLQGVVDEHVADSQDPLTGLKVFSLYGQTRRPSKESLEGVDTLVYDIQDIGARFYTYIATLGMCMEAAAENKIQFVVLDRPNPLTGLRVEGPLNDRDGLFTGYHTIPVVHGMTVGELALMYNRERNIHCDLQVVRMEGWKRSMWFDETNLVWVNPSPNMRSLTEATLYPAVGLLEATNVSVGRGTDTPFELFGAPWIEPRKLAAALNGLGLAGVRFIPYRFTPDASKFKGESCGGVQVLVTDRQAFKSVECGLALARTLHELFGEKFEYSKVDNLLFNKAILAEVKAGPVTGELGRLWSDDLARFLKTRANYLIYE